MSGLDTPYEVEYSKSDRSTCKTCDRGINKGVVRIGYKQKSSHHDGWDVSWHHLKCKCKQVRELKDLKHFEYLRWEDQEDIRKTYFSKETYTHNPDHERYVKELWEIKDDIEEGGLKGPAIKSIVEHNKGHVEKVSPVYLMHTLADWMYLGRTGACPTCKNYQVHFNGISYRCKGYATSFTKCDWTGTSIERYKVSLPDALKKHKYLSAFKYKKGYPTKEINYDDDDDEEDEEEEEEEEEEGEDGTKKEKASQEEEEDPNREEEEPPVGKELYGMVVAIAGTEKVLGVNTKELQSDIEEHGGSVVSSVAKATLMITCEEEVTKKVKTQKVKEAIKNLPIFPVSWIQQLMNREGEGIKLRKREVSKDMVIAPSTWEDDHEIADKYFTPKTSTTSTKKRKEKPKEPEVPIAPPRKTPKPGSNILKPDAETEGEIYVTHDEVYGATAYNVVLNSIDIAADQNRFYKIQLTKKGSTFYVFMKWGRLGVGSIGGSKIEKRKSFAAAKEIFAERFKYFTGQEWEKRNQFVKLGGKYFMTQLDDGWEDGADSEEVERVLKRPKSVDSSSLTCTLPNRTQELIKLMFDPEMMKKQLMSMNIDVERMPLGRIKKSQLMQGYAVLGQIQDVLAKTPPSKAALTDFTNQFYTLIPHNFGTSQPPLIDSFEMMKQKMDLVEALIDIDIANSLKKEAESAEGNLIENNYKSLKVQFQPLDKSGDLYNMLVDYVKNSHDSKQFRFGLNVEDIFAVDREGETSRFEPWKDNENRQLLWHGSRLTNWVGIISQGLRIAPPEAPKTGYRFGKGIYFADCVSKSASYCFTSRDNPTALMILCEVALGKMNQLEHDTYMEKAPTGTHSTKALGMAAPSPSGNKVIENNITVPLGEIAKTGLRTSCTHNEFIVYDSNKHPKINVEINNHPFVLEEVIFGKEITQGGGSKIECKDREIDVLWESPTPTSTVSTPLIVDLYGNGEKYIVNVNSQNFIDVLRGKDGERAFGFPFVLPDSTFASSPLVYDIDNDSRLDILVTTRNGEIVFISNDGFPVYDATLKVPPLKITKNWYEGLVGNHVDSAFSLHDTDNLRNTFLNKGDLHKDNRMDPEKQQQQQQQHQQQQQEDIFSWFSESYKQHITDTSDPLYSSKFEHYLKSNPNYAKKSSSHVWVDSHVLSTPVIADVDGDGKMDLIVSASYFFDQEYYLNPINRAKLDQDINIENYVAGGVVCFELSTGYIKWQTHLDLTTDNTTFKAYVYNTPTVVDLDGDGKLETIVGTALGFLYVLDYQGKPIKPFPLIMESIFSQVVAEDITGDGKLELIVSDSNGNVACFSHTGEEMWNQRIVSMTEHPVSIGDIDGDGNLDVVIGTFSGGIWAWNGKGEPLKHFPIKLQSSIISPLLLLDLSDSIYYTSEGKGMTIFVHSSDGILYSIDGKGGCVNKLDIGDSSISLILADDLTKNGYFNFIISTYSGIVYCMSTNIPFDPIKSKTSFNQGRNSFSSFSSSNPEQSGISILPLYRNPIDVRGQNYPLEFEIFGKRNTFSNFSDQMDSFKMLSSNLTYRVNVFYGSKKLYSTNYFFPGVKKLNIPINERSTELNTITIEMVDGNGLYFSDSTSVSFNRYFYRLLKWIVVLPFILTAILIVVYEDSKKSREDSRNILMLHLRGCDELYKPKPMTEIKGYMTENEHLLQDLKNLKSQIQNSEDKMVELKSNYAKSQSEIQQMNIENKEKKKLLEDLKNSYDSQNEAHKKYMEEMNKKKVGSK
eukprot:gene953-1208_t